MRDRFEAVFDVVASGQVDSLDDLVSLDVVAHQRIDGQGDGLPGLNYWIRTLHDVFLDLATKVEDTVVEGDRVAGRVTFSGTVESSRLNAAPTEPWVEFELFAFLRFRGGLVVEWWDARNTVQVLLDLGVEFVAPDQTGLGPPLTA